MKYIQTSILLISISVCTIHSLVQSASCCSPTPLAFQQNEQDQAAESSAPQRDVIFFKGMRWDDKAQKLVRDPSNEDGRIELPVGWVWNRNRGKVDRDLNFVLKTAKTIPFDGLNTTVAPTRSSSNAAKRDWQYPNKMSDNQKLALGWRQFLGLGCEHVTENCQLTKAENEVVVELIKQVIDKSFVEYGDVSELASVADQLARQPKLANDPYINHILSIAYGASFQRIKAIQCARTAILNYPDSTYPARFPAFVHMSYDQMCIRMPQYRRCLDSFCDSLLYWFENDYRASVYEQRFVIEAVDGFIDGLSGPELDRGEKLLARLESKKALPNWLRYIVRGKLNLRLAWDARGMGRASSVTEKGWINFNRHQALAEGFFEKAHDISPFFPEAATEMIDIARGGNSKEDWDFWFAKATAAQFDYLPAYKEMRFTLYPRWHGSPKAVFDFGLDALKTERFDTMVPFVFVESLLNLRDQILQVQGEQKRTFLLGGPVFDPLSECLSGLNAETESPKYVGFSRVDDSYLPTLEAEVLYLKEDYQKAKIALDKIGGKLNLFALQELLLLDKPEGIRATVAAMTGEHQADAKLANDFFTSAKTRFHLRNGKFEEKMKELMETVEDPNAAAFFRDRLDQHQLVEDFFGGDWVKFPFDNNHWQSSDFAVFDVVSPERILIDGNKGQGQFNLISSLRIPGDRLRSIYFEAQLNSLGAEVGAVVGINRQGPIYVGINENGLLFIGNLESPLTFYCPTRGNNQVHIQIGPGYLEVFHNEKPVLLSKNDWIQPAPQFSLLQRPTNNRSGQVTLSNLQLRSYKMKVLPETEESDYITHIENLQKEFGGDDNPYLDYHMGMAYHEKQRYEDAVPFYQSAIKKGFAAGEIALYLGDAFDRLGEHEKAQRIYQFAVDYKPEIRLASPAIAAAYPSYIASSRFRWNLMTDEETATIEYLKSISKRLLYQTNNQNSVEWVDLRMSAQMLAIEGKFDQALTLMKNAKKTTPAAHLDSVEAQIEAYQDNRIYLVDRTKEGYKPFYLDSGDMIIRPTLEKIIDHKRKYQTVR